MTAVEKRSILLVNGRLVRPYRWQTVVTEDFVEVPDDYPGLVRQLSYDPPRRCYTLKIKQRRFSKMQTVPLKGITVDVRRSGRLVVNCIGAPEEVTTCQ